MHTKTKYTLGFSLFMCTTLGWSKTPHVSVPWETMLRSPAIYSEQEAGWLLDWWLTTLVSSPRHGGPTFSRVSGDPWSAAQVCLIEVGAKLLKEKEDNQYYDVKKLNKVKVKKKLIHK
jgi:hypothetical protein